jgi:hypothetical protein
MCHRVMEKCGMVFDGEGEEAGTLSATTAMSLDSRHFGHFEERAASCTFC